MDKLSTKLASGRVVVANPCKIDPNAWDVRIDGNPHKGRIWFEAAQFVEFSTCGEWYAVDQRYVGMSDQFDARTVHHYGELVDAIQGVGEAMDQTEREREQNAG